MKKNKLFWILPLMILLLVSMVSAVPTAPDSSNTVAYYELEDLTDSTGNGYTLTNTGPAVSATGIINNGFDFSNDILTAGNLANIGTTDADSYSVCAWINPDNVNPATRAGITNKWNSPNFVFVLDIYNSKSDFIVRDGATTNLITSTTTITTGNEWFICGVYNNTAGSMELFVNSVSEDSIASGVNSEFNSQTVTIGSYEGANYFDGVIDEVSFFNVALSQDEIDYLYNSGSPTSAQQYPFVIGGVPVITQSSYNHSTAVNTSEGVVWRSNISTSSWTFDQTPTVKFDTNTSADCRVSNQDVNWSSLNSSFDCGTTGGSSHVCSLSDSFLAGSLYNCLYLSCANSFDNTLETSLSTSGCLNVSLGVFQFNGTTKDNSNLTVANSTVVAYEMNDFSNIFSTSSDGSGVWDLLVNTVNVSSKWVFNGFDPLNSTRAAGISHFVGLVVND